MFGNSLEFYVWENLSAKLVAHPQLDCTFTIYAPKQASAGQEEDAQQQEASPDQTPNPKPPSDPKAAEEDIGDKHPFPAGYPADAPGPEGEEDRPPSA